MVIDDLQQVLRKQPGLTRIWQDHNRFGACLEADQALDLPRLQQLISQAVAPCHLWQTGHQADHSSGGPQRPCLWGILHHNEPALARDLQHRQETLERMPKPVAERLLLDEPLPFRPTSTRRQFLQDLLTARLPTVPQPPTAALRAAFGFAYWLRLTPTELHIGPTELHIGPTELHLGRSHEGTTDQLLAQALPTHGRCLPVLTGGPPATCSLITRDAAGRHMPIIHLRQQHNDWVLHLPPALIEDLCAWHRLRLPLHLAPEQAVVTPVSPAQAMAAQHLYQQLSEQGIRATWQPADSPLRARLAPLLDRAIPACLVVGQREIDSQTLTVRWRDQADLQHLQLHQLLERLREA